MQIELDIDEHKGVGPMAKMYNHGPVTTIVPESGDGAAELFICLDCGYCADDSRLFAHEPCERADNRINQTWREYFTDDGDADPLPTADDGECPIEY